jgi:hypothetical protein
MTAKEEAQELIHKFAKPIDALHKYPMCYETSKQCALIAVDEIILTTFKKESWDKWFLIPQIESTTEYWQEVKQEIEKL